MNLFNGCWAIRLLVWLALAFRNKRTARLENLASWALHMLPLMVAAVLLSADRTPWALATGGVAVGSPGTGMGLALTFGGLAFTRMGARPPRHQLERLGTGQG
ncbi:MAG: hypothetical protein WC617_17915 [Rhodanobacter sp.]|jgi:hypothetical protein